MKKFAVIVGGGAGVRMGGEVPKQFLQLNGKPILFYALKAFTETYKDCTIILVLPEQHIARGQEIIDAYFDYNYIRITAGGRTRFHSVKNGLALVDDEESIVYVHDAVRPLVNSALLERCTEEVLKTGSAIPAVDCRDSVRIITETGNEAFDRTLLRLIQTPQCFHSKILLPAFRIDYKDWFTDEASVAEAFGIKLSLVEGDPENIKITGPADIAIAEALLSRAERTAG